MALWEKRHLFNNVRRRNWKLQDIGYKKCKQSVLNMLRFFMNRFHIGFSINLSVEMGYKTSYFTITLDVSP